MINILETERQIDEELGMDSLYVKYKVDGKIRGTTFSHYNDAIELIDGVERFKRKISEKVFRERNPIDKKFIKKSIKINNFKNHKIEIKKQTKTKKDFNFEIDKITEEGEFLDISIKDTHLRFKVPRTMEKKNEETGQPQYFEFIERELKKVK